MKTALLLCGSLLLLCAPTTALAARYGMNLNWGDGCWNDGSPVAARSFACNSNSGSATMVASFALSRNGPEFAGVGVIIDGKVDAPSLPDWWQLYNGGACRMTSLTSSADFRTAPSIGCADPWGGRAVGGISAWQTRMYPPPPPVMAPAANRMRLKIAYTLAEVSPLTAGVEYYCVKATVDYQKTVGTPSCAGCATPATFELNTIYVWDVLGATRELIYTPLDNTCLTWQTSTVPCGFTPSNSPAWGRVKSLYR
jgi:hypothetical protein